MNSDDWCTPDDLFQELHKEFHFNIDLCATTHNSKCMYFCENYFDNEIVCSVADNWLVDYLEFGEEDEPIITAFMNPPYSNPYPFLEKAWEKDSFEFKIVCLVKCDPSTKWWALFWDYKLNCPKAGCEVRFFPKRIKFHEPSGKSSTAAPFPSALIIMNRLV